MTTQPTTANSSPLAQFALNAKSHLQRYEYHMPILSQWQHLISALRDKGPTKQWVTLINPPFIPNDRYLQTIGLDKHYIRIVRLSEHNPSIKSYIQRCLLNGKSAIVAIWSTAPEQLPDILQDDDAIRCRTLLFSDKQHVINTQAIQQLELAF